MLMVLFLEFLKPQRVSLALLYVSSQFSIEIISIKFVLF
jgi:hypothetical protein